VSFPVSIFGVVSLGFVANSGQEGVYGILGCQECWAGSPGEVLDGSVGRGLGRVIGKFAKDYGMGELG